MGGPAENDNYVDRRNDAVQKEVATDYNAGFQTAVAALVMLGFWTQENSLCPAVSVHKIIQKI